MRVPALTSEGRAETIESLVAPSLQAEGFDIVRVLFSGDRRPKLQIMVERQDGRAVSVDDCALASRLVSAVLDVEDPVSGSYVLSRWRAGGAFAAASWAWNRTGSVWKRNKSKSNCPSTISKKPNWS
jgi:hypothetical protein